MKISLVALNGRYTHSCLALYYVRNELEQRAPGCSIAIHQLTINDPYYDTLLRLTGEDADALFFSVYIWNVVYVRRLIQDLFRIIPETRIILGGPEATNMGDQTLPSYCTTVRGPVEGLAVEFYDDLKAKHFKPEYTAHANTFFGFPYRDEDFTTTLQNRSIYYESSRGCPFSCTYCLSSIEKGVRNREMDSVKNDLETILKHNPKTLRFVDRTFNANSDRTIEIWKHLAEKSGETLCHFEIAPDLFTDPMFSFLETLPSRRFQFEIGIQSTNPETLAAVKRPMDFEKASANIKRLVALDSIHLHLDLILGLPYETEATFKKSFNDVFALFPHYIQMGLLKILPGTPISQSVDKYEIIHCGQPPCEILATRWMDHETIRRLYLFGECVEAFFNNRFFRSTFQYIHKSKEDAFAFFSSLVAVCEKNDFFAFSKTQKLMCRMLCELAEQRTDRDLLHDLLRYDWLLCGHRFLPELLQNQDFRKVKDALWRTMPDILPYYYENQTARNKFFKRSVFAEFSSELKSIAGLTGKATNGIVCFLPVRTEGVFQHQKTIMV